MLFVLVLAQRAQTISLMNVSGLTWLGECVLIGMKDLLKHNRVGQPLEVFQISRFNKDETLPGAYSQGVFKSNSRKEGGEP